MRKINTSLYGTQICANIDPQNPKFICGLIRLILSSGCLFFMQPEYLVWPLHFNFAENQTASLILNNKKRLNALMGLLQNPR